MKIAILTNSLSINGISNVIRNYCENINLSKFEITILAGMPIDITYQKIFNNLDIKLIALPSRHKNTFKYCINLYKALKKEKFDILHVHGNSANSSIELFVGFMAQIKIRIMHVHNTVCDHLLLHKILLPFFNMLCTHRFACGIKAGEWIYGKNNFYVIPNGFITEKFKFNIEDRNRIRKKLNLENNLIIGHIGRINYPKNQIYLLDVFKDVASKCDNAILLFVGTGPYYDKISELISHHPYKDRIILYGESNEAFAMYSAIDIFTLPSRFEGMPIVLLEAQMSGLPCIVSEKVTREVDFGDIKWLSIESEPAVWSNAILKTKINTNDRSLYYDKHLDIIKKYQIKENAKALENLYINIYEKNLKK